MSASAHGQNLLDAPLISSQPAVRHSLPGLLAAMARDEVRSFPRLRAHQRAAWHMFLVQLAVLAMDRVGLEAPPDEEGAWRAALLALTDGDEDSWALVGPEDRPAFMQPAVVPGVKWKEVTTADALDLLITAKNHDLKQHVARRGAPEDWVFALVSLQTGEGYGGKLNYGIARMNGGSSSRPLMGIAPARGRSADPDPSAWFRRDATALARQRREEDEPSFGTRGGPALLWCRPWPEGPGLAAHLLDPLFIEVCRRVRLDVKEDRIIARRANSVAARVNAKDLKGIPGDPWAPVHADDSRPLTLSEHGDFGYSKVVDLLHRWRLPPLATTVSGDGDSLLILEALARGNAKTAGHKTRAIPVPGKVRPFFNQPSAGLVAQDQIKEIEAVSRALAGALALFAARGEAERRDQRRKQYFKHAEAPRARLDARADDLFFPALWDRLAAQQASDQAAGDTAKRAFLAALLNAARAEFEAALAIVPCPVIHRPRAEARARRAFEGMLRTSPLLMPVFVKRPAHG